MKKYLVTPAKKNDLKCLDREMGSTGKIIRKSISKLTLSTNQKKGQRYTKLQKMKCAKYAIKNGKARATKKYKVGYSSVQRWVKLVDNYRKEKKEELGNMIALSDVPLSVFEEAVVGHPGYLPKQGKSLK